MAKDVQSYNVSRAMWRRNDGGIVQSLNDSSNMKMELLPLLVSTTYYSSLSLQPVNSTPLRRITIENVASNAGFAISRSWQTHSSRRWKDDICNLSDGLDNILKITPRYFRWKDDETGKIDAGFIAEEVEVSMPVAVARDEQGHPDGIDFSRIIPYLVSAVQAQQATIEALTKRIEALEARG